MIYTANLTYYGGGPIRSDGVGYYVYPRSSWITT